MKNAFDNDAAKAAHDEAITLVKRERLLQIENGFTPDHDDEHQSEELAAAAACLLVPIGHNPDVCVSTGSALNLLPLHQLLAEAAWEDLDREDTEHYMEDAAAFERRLKAVVIGVSLGLAELERLLRMRNALIAAGGAQ